jgi:hypothetical protein
LEANARDCAIQVLSAAGLRRSSGPAEGSVYIKAMYQIAQTCLPDLTESEVLSMTLQQLLQIQQLWMVQTLARASNT